MTIFFIQFVLKKLLDLVFVISRIVKVLVRVISLPRPWLFWISQKPHPIIVYNHARDSQNEALN